MPYLVENCSYLQVPYQDARGKWRYSTTVAGDIVTPDVSDEALAPYIAAGRVRHITDEQAARLPRARDPWRDALDCAAGQLMQRRG